MSELTNSAAKKAAQAAYIRKWRASLTPERADYHRAKRAEWKALNPTSKAQRKEYKENYDLAHPKTDEQKALASAKRREVWLLRSDAQKQTDSARALGYQRKRSAALKAARLAQVST